MQVSARLNDMATLYIEHCAACHGVKGDGKSTAKQQLNPAPKDFTRFQVAAELSRERMIGSITHGLPNTAMEGWEGRLSPEQIAGIVDYIRVSFMPAVTTETAMEGRRVYARHCSVCHGDTGQGAVWARSGLSPPPANFTESSMVAKLNRERMISSVSYGRAQTAMPAWKGRLSDEQIEQTVDYIRYSIMKLPTDALHQAAGHVAAGSLTAKDEHDHDAHGVDELDAPLPFGLVGSEQMGGDLYHRNCADCHGVTGEGNGPRAYFILPKPRDFRQPEAQAKYSRAHLFEVISKGVLGSEMPAWDKVMTDAEIGHLSEYVYKAFIEHGKAAGSD
ncbi:MAG: c-type cytochrome [Halopseudomonas sp.]